MDDDILANPPRLGVGAITAVLAMLALMGTTVAGTLAWRNQIDTVSTSRAMAELQSRWTIAQRELSETTSELESATAELSSFKAAQAARAEADRRAETELAGLRVQVAKLERELAALRQQLASDASTPEAPPLSAPPPTQDQAPIVAIAEPDREAEALVGPPMVTFSPSRALLLPAPGAAPPSAVLRPRPPEDPPTAWLLPAPGGAPPEAILRPPEVP